MRQEEDSIYSLNTINSGALLQKQQANVSLNDHSWIVLP
jgi:hypothetical protein